ncbi:MAG: sulfite exporter TauE/SafE family protein [Candidatus Falkowbacteria bacterium]
MSSQYYTVRLPIKGMHCRSCEILIEEKLKEISHVKKVEVDYKVGEAVVYYDGQAPDNHSLNKAIVEAGYKVGEPDKLPLLTNDKKEYVSLGIAFLILMVVYLLLKILGLTDINLNPDLSSPSWGLIVVIGLVAGFSTCMALVGGLSLGLSSKFAENHPTATSGQKFRPHLFFVSGRILGYAALGGLLGSLGSVFQFSATANAVLTLLVGAVMLIMGLQLINIFPRLNTIKFSLPKGISKALGISKKQKEYSHKHAMVMGALTFFLPCGFTQAMQLYAVSTGSFSSGALTMGLFALGTAPGLLSIGGVAALVQGSFKEKFFKVAGLAVIFFALFNLNNGYTLAGLSLGSSNNSDTSNQGQEIKDPNVTMEDGVQVVRMTEVNNGYQPNQFSIRKGIPVKWIINAEAPYSCASSLVVPKLNIQKTLVAGENIIEFTPKNSGKIPFSCSMGMYTGSFTVYDDSTSIKPSDNNAVNVAQAAAPTPSGSCGSGKGGCGCGGMARKQPVTTNNAPVVAKVIQDNTNQNDVQVIKAIYTASNYLAPSTFTVKTGAKVRLEIEVKDSGYGCGSAITIPQLYDSAEQLQAGSQISMEFTPTTPGTYDITCGMGMIRFGSITVE